MHFFYALFLVKKVYKKLLFGKVFWPKSLYKKKKKWIFFMLAHDRVFCGLLNHTKKYLNQKDLCIFVVLISYYLLHPHLLGSLRLRI